MWCCETRWSSREAAANTRGAHRRAERADREAQAASAADRRAVGVGAAAGRATREHRTEVLDKGCEFGYGRLKGQEWVCLAFQKFVKYL